MTIDIRPETEQLVREEIRNGHFQSVDDLIVSGRRERNPAVVAATPGQPLSEFFRQSPLVDMWKRWLRQWTPPLSAAPSS